MTARASLFCVLMMVAGHAHSQCDVKIYQDTLFVSSGPSCLAASGGREKIAAGVKNVVGELNEVSRASEGGERNMSTRDKLYRLAEFQHRDKMINQTRAQNELRQNNQFARQQRGLN
jgi:hypothetical protein